MNVIKRRSRRGRKAGVFLRVGGGVGGGGGDSWRAMHVKEIDMNFSSAASTYFSVSPVKHIVHVIVLIL